MGQKKRIPLGVLTVSSKPHTNDGTTYYSLLKLAYELGKPIRIRGADEFAFIASCVDFNPNAQPSDLTGEIHKYTEISAEDWENIRTRKAATVDDLKELNIPEHLKANREVFRYFFFVKDHRFVFQLKGSKRSISHSAAQILLQSLFNTEKVKAEYPLVSVTIACMIKSPLLNSSSRIFSGFPLVSNASNPIRRTMKPIV